MLNQKLNDMKKLLGVILICSSALVFTSLTYASPSSGVCSEYHFQDHHALIGDLDAVSPSVLPVCDATVTVYAVNTCLSENIKEVKPTANSPPNRWITE